MTTEHACARCGLPTDSDLCQDCVDAARPADQAFEDCGTYAAYQRHKKRGIPVDEDCRQAMRDYARQYRAENPEVVRQDYTLAVARSRALSRLARYYPAKYNELLIEERQRMRSSRQKARS